MLEAKWEAVVKLSLIQEPRLGEKLMPLRAIKETRYNITVGSHDKGARDSATHMIGAYTEAINKITTAVWGEARGIRVEECAPPGAEETGGEARPPSGGIPIGAPPSLGSPLPPPPASSLAAAPAMPHSSPVAAAAMQAPARPSAPKPQPAAPTSFLDTVAPSSLASAGVEPSPAPAGGAPAKAPSPAPAPKAMPSAAGAVPQDALLAGLLEEMRKKLRAEIEGEVRLEAERFQQGLRQTVEAEVAASILETNKKAELQDTMMMVMDGKQLVQEVWQIWANLETLMAQSKDEELRKHIFVAEEKLHALLMLASRLLPVAVVEDRVHKSTHKK